MRRLLLLSLLSLACSKGKGASADAAPRETEPAPPAETVVVLDEVALQLAGWPAAAPKPDEAKLRERISGELALSNLFVHPGEDAPPGARRARVVLSYGVAAEGEDARAAVSLTLRWKGTYEDPNLVEAVGCDGKVADAPDLLECAVTRAVKGIIGKEKVRRGEVGVVLAALETDDESLRAVALEAVRTHGLRAAVPKLLVMLESKDEAVRDGAIGALAALKEPSAVKPMIALADFRDPATMARVIDAIGMIGGEEATAWLELVASGHENPTIRRMAETALRPPARDRPSPP